MSGPHFGGWEIHHLKGSAADPNRLYASQSSGRFGQVIQRSNDGGTTWEPVGNKFVYEGVLSTRQWYDGTPHPWEFKRVWHHEPSPTDPDTVYAGAEDAALFRSIVGGQTWQELPGLRGHGSGSAWQPGAGGMCLHTIVLDPSHPGERAVLEELTLPPIRLAVKPEFAIKAPAGLDHGPDVVAGFRLARRIRRPVTSRIEPRAIEDEGLTATSDAKLASKPFP